MEQKKNNKGIISTLFDIFAEKSKDSSQSLAEKKNVNDNEIDTLVRAVKNLSEIVNHHNAAINELYLLQAQMLKEMTSSGALDGIDSSVTPIKKNNKEKPN